MTEKPTMSASDALGLAGTQAYCATDWTAEFAGKTASALCDTQLVESGGEQDQFCIEHVVPSSMGGPHHLVNYVPSCRSCNNSKGDRHVLYFIRNSFVLRDRKPAPVSPIMPIAEAAE